MLDMYLRNGAVGEKLTIVSDAGLSYAGLVSSFPHEVYHLPTIKTNAVNIGDLRYERNHLHGQEYAVVIGDLIIPNQERAIVDTIKFIETYPIEGFLIEALQTYQDLGHKVADLYEVADFYEVPREDIDYWWKEAEESESMSYK